MGRWRTIRDNYVRSLKKQTNNSRSGSAAKKTKLYVYEEQLSFLGKNRELRNTDSNFEDQPLSEPTSPNINEKELIHQLILRMEVIFKWPGVLPLLQMKNQEKSERSLMWSKL